MGDTKKDILVASEEEFSNLLQEIYSSSHKGLIKKLNFFIKSIQEYLSQYDNKATNIGILGLNIPDELIVACGANPIWINSGSFITANHAETFLPRDTAPEVKSFLGILTSGVFEKFEHLEYIIVPIYSDSMRKVAYILSKKFKVIPIDIPPIRNSESSFRKWNSQMIKMVRVICSITKKNSIRKKLVQRIKVVNDAKEEFAIFKKNYSLCNGIISAKLYTLIINSFYMSQDIRIWTDQLKEFNRIIIKFLRNNGINYINYNSSKPRVLVAGSPIYFPNYKLPSLFDDAKIHLVKYESEMENKLTFKINTKNTIFENRLIKNLAMEHYKNDLSFAFTDNSLLLKKLDKSLEECKVDGMIYHVLKGQVASDFEFESVENLCIKKDIPILRVETDYNYQDIEQLRIRIEAFSEILGANKKTRRLQSQKVESDLKNVI